MVKYSEYFKRQFVNEYLKGSIGYDWLAYKIQNALVDDS